MASSSPLPENLETIAVFRALQLGDLLCAVPAVRALRAAYPQAHIALIGLPWAQAFVDRFDLYFDEFISFPGFPGLPEQPFVAEKTMQFFADMQARNFDLIIQMQGNGNINNPLLTMCGAKSYAGFYREGNYRPHPDCFMEYPTGGHEIYCHLSLMNFLAIPSQGEHLEFPLNEDDYNAAAQLDLGLEAGGYVCIHPGARAKVRHWDTANFARLGDFCAEAGYRVVLTGVDSERHLTRAVADAMTHDALDLAGQTTLGAVGVLIQQSRLLISNDTGVSHVAAALRHPSVVISLSHDQERWSPLDSSINQVVNGHSADAYTQALARVRASLGSQA
ncbi:LPS biosynthesis glycosyltransferase [bacterium]|nr:LPS biosynthesis glycosyltransferase [bacterium]